MYRSMIKIYEKKNEFEGRPWLVFETCTEVPNVMRGKVWICRTWFR